MKDYFIKDISAETKFEPIERRNGVYVATFLLSETEDTRRIATARYSSKPTEEQVQTDFAEWKKRYGELLLNAAKQRKLDEITEYNDSDNVNGFFINGAKVWVDAETRVKGVNGAKAKQTLGATTMSQWLGGQEFTLSPNMAVMLYAQIESYALDCQNVTEAHKAAVLALTSLEEVENYDVTKGYPDMLSFTI